MRGPMSVSCGIVGLPNVGKSTIFSALSSAKAEVGNFPFCTIEPNVAVVEVPDARLEVIHGYVNTQKVIPAVVKVVDIAGLVAGASEGEGMGNKFLGNIKECDAIMQVVRCFGGEKVLREGPIDPIGDIEIIELELELADMETLRRNVDRVGKKARAGDKDSQFEKETFDAAIEILDGGKPLRVKEWNERQRAVLKPLFLMTMKPVLYVANVADDDLEGESEYCKLVSDYAASHGSDWLPICGDLELELRSMEGEDREVFMEDLGVKELGLERLIQTVYHLLGLQTYFTAGEKEVRAWTIHRGDTAPTAAGVIHTDFEKAFIRAEVYSVDDLEQHESETAIRAAGRLRTEGRDYAMQDGDIAHFLVGK